VTRLRCVLAFVLERARPEREDYRPWDQALRIEVAHYLVDYNLGYGLAMLAYLGAYAGVGVLTPVVLWPGRWPVAAQVALALVLSDLLSYWQHRLFHRLPRLWRFHAIHHRGTRLNFPRAVRFHFVDISLGTFLSFLPLALMRAPMEMVTWLATWSGVLGILFHMNVRMRTPRWLDRWICTPAVHRWHHSDRREESEGNFGTCVMLYDRLFGTYLAPAPEGPVHVGVEKEPLQGSFLEQLAEPFRASR